MDIFSAFVTVQKLAEQIAIDPRADLNTRTAASLLAETFNSYRGVAFKLRDWKPAK